MSSNHTGLLAKDGNLYDWIEIKNLSQEKESLSGYSLYYEGNSNNKEKDNKQKTWSFPDMEIHPGGRIVVFASKKNTQSISSELHTNFKLSSSGGKLALLHDDEVVSEIRYDSLDDDQCYRRLADGRYEKSNEPSPGFENTKSGYEEHITFLDKQRNNALLIWEIHPKGYKSGKAWIEIKNTSEESVNLKDYCLATSPKNIQKWHFPSKELKSGEYFVVNCKQDSFKIGKDCCVILSYKGKFIDGICAQRSPYGVSMGRIKGKSGFFFFTTPSKGSENTSPHYRFMAPLPTFSPIAGVYPTDTAGINVTINSHGFKVHYTIDGSEPTSDSPTYKDTIRIEKTRTIRAYCEGDSSTLRSNIATSTYILGDSHTLPVVNVTIKPSDLYNYNTGIYEAGPGASSEYPHHGANYWKKWWKKAHIELYDGNGGFSEDCELAIFGGYSRTLAKKSFKIRFKDTVGPSSINYDLYATGSPIKVKKFILRSGSQDISGIMARDEFFTSLMHSTSPSLLIQAYRPVALYINGEYFGLYYIREKIDKDFVASHLNVSNKSISIVFSTNTAEEGSDKGYNELMSYVRSHNMSATEHFNYVKDRFDLDGLIDYKIGEYYSCNTDIGNVRYVHSDDPRGDKKWHIVFYDIDISWRDTKPSSHYLRSTGQETFASPSRQNKLISELLKNKEFRQLFLERFSMHIHKTFNTEYVTTFFDKLIETIKPEMELNCKRWPHLMSYSDWCKHVEQFRAKLKSRSQTMVEDIRKELSVTPEENKKYFSDLGY